MRHLRALARLAVMIPFTIVSYVAFQLTRPLDRLAPAAGRWTQERLTINWARGMLGLLGARVHVTGNPSRTAHILVSNHLSYIDILVYLSQGCWTMVAKSEVAGWPGLGMLARSVGTVFIDRSRRSDLTRVIQLVRDELDRGRSVLFFPEGTSSSGSGLLPFKPSLFEVALAADRPLHAAALSYRTADGQPPAEQSVCWWDETTFLEHAYPLLGLRRFEALVAFDAEPLTATDRKSLARNAQAAVLRLFTPVCSAPATQQAAS